MEAESAPFGDDDDIMEVSEMDSKMTELEDFKTPKSMQASVGARARRLLEDVKLLNLVNGPEFREAPTRSRGRMLKESFKVFRWIQWKDMERLKKAAEKLQKKGVAFLQKRLDALQGYTDNNRELFLRETKTKDNLITIRRILGNISDETPSTLSYEIGQAAALDETSSLPTLAIRHSTNGSNDDETELGRGAPMEMLLQVATAADKQDKPTLETTITTTTAMPPRGHVQVVEKLMAVAPTSTGNKISNTRGGAMSTPPATSIMRPAPMRSTQPALNPSNQQLTAPATHRATVGGPALATPFSLGESKSSDQGTTPEQLFCGRYKIYDGPALHVGETFVAVHADDYGIVDDVFNLHRNLITNQLDRTSCINALCLLARWAQVATTPEELLAESAIKEMFPYQGARATRAAFKKYCHAKFGGKLKVILQFVTRAGQREEEISIRKMLDPDFVVELLPSVDTTVLQRQLSTLVLPPSCGHIVAADVRNMLVIPGGAHNLVEILHRERLDEKDIKNALRQIAAALARLHEKGLVHGNLTKLNVVRMCGAYKLLDLNAATKIGDPFGSKFSSGVLPPEMFFDLGLSNRKSKQYREYWRCHRPKMPIVALTMRGTIVVKAFGTPRSSTAKVKTLPFEPEKASPAMDAWALGCLMYELWTGRELVETDNHQHVEEDQIKTAATWTNDKLAELIKANVMHPHAQDLLKHLFVVEKEKRWTMDQVLKHTYFDDAPTTSNSCPVQQQHVSTLKAFFHNVQADAMHTAKYAFCSKLLVKLKELHARGLIHGNLSLENVIVTDNMDVLLDKVQHATRVNKSVSWRDDGNAEYCPPELARNVLAQAPDGSRAQVGLDMWSFAVLLLKLFSPNMNLVEFAGQDRTKILATVASKKFSFQRSLESAALSAPQKELLQRCFVNPTLETLETLLPTPDTNKELRDLNWTLEFVSTIIASDPVFQDSFPPADAWAIKNYVVRNAVSASMVFMLKDQPEQLKALFELFCAQGKSTIATLDTAHHVQVLGRALSIAETTISHALYSQAEKDDIVFYIQLHPARAAVVVALETHPSQLAQLWKLFLAETKPRQHQIANGHRAMGIVSHEIASTFKTDFSVLDGWDINYFVLRRPLAADLIASLQLQAHPLKAFLRYCLVEAETRTHDPGDDDDDDEASDNNGEVGDGDNDKVDDDDNGETIDDALLEEAIESLKSAPTLSALERCVIQAFVRTHPSHALTILTLRDKPTHLAALLQLFLNVPIWTPRDVSPAPLAKSIKWCANQFFSLDDTNAIESFVNQRPDALMALAAVQSHPKALQALQEQVLALSKSERNVRDRQVQVDDVMDDVIEAMTGQLDDAAEAVYMHLWSHPLVWLDVQTAEMSGFVQTIIRDTTKQQRHDDDDVKFVVEHLLVTKEMGWTNERDLWHVRSFVRNNPAFASILRSIHKDLPEPFKALVAILVERNKTMLADKIQDERN
ncbi:Aste57867_19486 [Aphanomyces stellatus]|uniref:Aste57867_19486 protein n=1 Tax=Aphanomyces stellatus TaxID=120398 RepID=A0A485LCX9_9STRA|nr:hypothetical protein As57867_019422 [Aphanomyces stellatus]VFT96197.1 Aste57867_19486 [Aphanomyces stellatus]